MLILVQINILNFCLRIRKYCQQIILNHEKEMINIQFHREQICYVVSYNNATLLICYKLPNQQPDQVIDHLFENIIIFIRNLVKTTLGYMIMLDIFLLAFVYYFHIKQSYSQAFNRGFHLSSNKLNKVYSRVKRQINSINKFYIPNKIINSFIKMKNNQRTINYPSSSY
ncbi:hypothetical protein pb186bvf_020538 [Paramecium bursaria]